MERIGEILKRQKAKSPTQDHQPTQIEEPTPEIKCHRCSDGKFLHPLKEDGKPDYSKVVSCRHCMTDDSIRRALGVSSLESTFANFKAVKGSEDAFKSASSMATLKTDWKLLLIYGAWGNGKTHLLEAIALELWNKGHYARIQTFPDFVARLKGTFDKATEPGDTSFNNLMSDICSTEYLLLDDVGTAGSFTPFSLEQLERIMLARYRDNLFTVITTNLDIEPDPQNPKLAFLPRFVTSRFRDSEKARMAFNEAPDYRPKKKGGER